MGDRGTGGTTGISRRHLPKYAVFNSFAHTVMTITDGLLTCALSSSNKRTLTLKLKHPIILLHNCVAFQHTCFLGNTISKELFQTVRDWKNLICNPILLLKKLRIDLEHWAVLKKKKNDSSST